MHNYAVVMDSSNRLRFKVPARWHKWNVSTSAWEHKNADQLPIGHLGALSANSFFSTVGPPAPSARYSYDTCREAAVASSSSLPVVTFTNPMCTQFVNLGLGGAGVGAPGMVDAR